jgi:hypothetical protein
MNHHVPQCAEASWQAETRDFITTFTKACHCTAICARWIHSTSKRNINIIFPFTSRSSQWCLPFGSYGLSVLIPHRFVASVGTFGFLRSAYCVRLHARRTWEPLGSSTRFCLVTTKTTITSTLHAGPIECTGPKCVLPLPVQKHSSLRSAAAKRTPQKCCVGTPRGRILARTWTHISEVLKRPILKLRSPGMWRHVVWYILTLWRNFLPLRCVSTHQPNYTASHPRRP